MDSVTFTYPGRKRPVVRDVSLHFAANQSTAIVGPSGSGKSTAAQLLTQVLHPCEGNIRIGDACMKEISRDWILQHVAEVPQVRTSPVYSDATVADFIGGVIEQHPDTIIISHSSLMQTLKIRTVYSAYNLSFTSHGVPTKFIIAA